jgi:hypothetical protein
MVWKLFHVTRSLTKLAPPPAPELDQCYFPRLNVEPEVKKRLARRDNFVLYGPARQGKTMLLSACLPIRDSIYIECRPDFKRPHLYRLILASLGYSISTEKKRKQKADYKIKFGLLGTNMGAGVDLEQERTLQEINVDLKNPSEVAHLISRIPNLPYVVLNGFHLLDPNTKKNFLFDLAFFAERSEIRFIIVGSWLQVDYLEAIEPAITGKLHYIPVPFWAAEELRAAHRFWCDRQVIKPVLPEILEEMISLSGGDIALFAALMAMPPASSIDSLRRDAIELVVSRSLRGLEARIEELLNRREIAFSYDAIHTEIALEANPNFHPIPGATDATYQRVAINPETGRPFSKREEVKIDATGTPQYRENVNVTRVTRVGRIGDFVLYKFYQAVRAGSDTLQLSELVAEFMRDYLPDSIGIDAAKLTAIFLQIHEAQRLAPISPPLIEVTSDARALHIADRRFYLTLKSMGPDDFEDWFEKRRPSDTPKPRRRANISSDITQEDLDQLFAQASKAAVRPPASQPASHVAQAPNIRRAPVTRRAASPKKIQHPRS